MTEHGCRTPAPAGRSVLDSLAGTRGATAFCLAALLLLTTCRLDELTSPGELGRIDVSELSHLDSARLGSTAPRSRTATLSIIGSTASLPFAATIQGGSPWLALSAASGTAPGSLTLTLEPEGLALGEHKDTVVFTAGVPDAIPVKVGVTFRIIGCREDALGALPATASGGITAEDCASSRSPGRFARLYRFSAAANDSVTLAATSLAFAPSVAIGSATAGSVPLAESVDCPVGAADGNACLRYVRLPSAGEYLIEVTSVGAGATGAHTLTVGMPRAPDVPATLAQEAIEPTPSALAVGAAVPSTRVMLRAALADADLDSLRLQVELRPANEAFTGVVTATSAWGNGPAFGVEQAGLSDNVGYHWRARAIDPTGRASAWVEFGGNATAASDFTVSVADSPAAPASLAQFRADGVTPIAAGGTTNESLAVLRATVSDPDPGDQLRLDVEVRPVGAAFTGVPSASSALVTPGAVASVTFAGLSDDIGYRWRARTVDGAGRASAWTTFGSSAAADFRAALPPVQLAFTVQPSVTSAGGVITPAVRVVARGASGEVRTSFTGIVTVALGTSGGGTLSGTTSVSAVGGVAMFNDLSLDVAGTYALIATVGALQATSAEFTVGAGSGQTLMFVSAPATGTAGVALSPAPQVRVHDALGNVAAGFTGDVTLALAPNAAGASLVGTTTVAAVSGVATFADVRIERAGSGFTFAATGTALSGAQGGSIDIAPAAAAALELITAPAVLAGSGVALTTQPVLRLLDDFGNPVPNAGVLVSASISSGPGGASLTNATTTTDADGVATFSGLSLTGSGGAYTLAFASAGLEGAASGSITLGAGAASRLTIVTQPAATARSGEILGTQPAVRLLDGPGNLVETAGVPVTASIASGGGTLGGTTTVLTGADGVAAFAELSISGTAGARSLRFSADGLADAMSSSIALGAGDATSMTRASVNGQSAQAGSNVPVAPTVLVRDASGNPVAGVAVTFAVVAGAGTVSPTSPVLTDASGLATLTSWTLGAAVGENLVEASVGGLDGSPVTFGATGVAGVAAGLLIAGGDDLSGPVGTALGTAHEVRVVDANGNPVAGVSVAWAALGGGSVSPPLSVSGANGIAQAVRTLGGTAGPQGTTATASIGGSPVVVTFDVTATVGGPSQLSLVSGDAQAGTVGAALAEPLAVLVRDTEGNPVAGVLITWSVVDGGGSVAPTTSLTNASGVASTIWTLGTVTTPTDSTQLARATGVGSPVNFIATSRAGAVSASQTLVAVNPASVGASRNTPVTVTVTARDAFANPVPNQGVVLAASGSGITLVQPVALTDASGIATGAFGSTTTGAHVLSATVNALAALQQPTVTVVPAPAARLAFVTAPSTVTAGAAIGPAVTVELLDSLGNRATTSAATITLSFAATPGTAALGGTVARAAVAGVATFPDLSVNRAGLGYRLGAASGTLTGVVSPEFEVLTGAVSAARSLVSAAPGSVAAGVQSVITVTARDANDNPVAGAAVTLSMSGAGNTIEQPVGVTDANGIATGAVSSTVAGPKSVTATVGSVAVAQAAALTVTPAAVSAAESGISASPGAISADGGAATITVTARDAFGNPVPGATVVLAASGTLNTLAQPVTVTNALGVATGSLASTRAEEKTVTATINGIALAPTASVTVGVGAVSAARSSVLSSTASLVAGAAGATITVTARDANDNPVAGAAVVLAASGTANSLTQPAAVTDANGVATGSLASTMAEQKTVTASAAGVAISQAAVVTVAPAAVSAAQSSVVAAPTTVASGEASTITITARDAFDNLIPGATVLLAASGSGNTIEQPAVTSALGVTTGTVSSSVAEQKTVTATVAGVGITQAPVVTVTAGTVSAATSTVSAAPGTLAAGAATSTITVTARDASGNPVAGVAVVLTASGADNVLVQPAPTGADGVTTGTIASTRAGTKSVSATVGGVAVTQVADVVVTPAALSTTASTVQLSSNVISAGVGSATVTVTARDEFLNPISGATVVLAATGDGNALTQPTATTDAAGVATGAFSSTVSEAKTVTATVNGSLLAQAPVVTVTPDAADATQSTLQLAASSIVAGETVSVTVTARDASGNVIPGVTVGLLATGGGNTVTSPVATTDANGVATGSFRSTVAEGKTISATVNGVTMVQTGALTVTPAAVSPAASSVVPSAASIVAGTGASGITVTVRDEFLNVIQGAAVTLASSGGALTQPAAVTDASGVATGSFSSTATGSFTVSATAAGTGITQQAAVNVTPGAISPTLSTVTADPTALVAGGASAITVTARDVNNNVVPGATVLLAATGDGNSVGDPGAVTDANGVTIGSFSSTRAEAKVVTATINGVAVTAGAAITVGPAAVDAAASGLVVDLSTIAALSGTSTITVTARDAFQNLVPGASVVLAASGTGNTVGQPAGSVADANGVATGTLSSTVAGDKVVSATVGGVVLAATPTVTVTPDVVAGAQSTIQLSGATAAAGASVGVTVTARDASGNVVPGATVVLAVNGADVVITQPGTTDALGVAAGSFVATVAEVKTVSATINSIGVSISPTVTITPAAVSAGLSTVTVDPPSIVAGGTGSTITVTVRDLFGNAVPGATVTLAASGDGNTVTDPAAVTDAAGVATGSLSSTLSGPKTITATVGATALSQQPIVTVTAGAVSAAQSSVAVSSATTAANVGITVTVTARDASGNPVPNATVVIAGTGTGNSVSSPIAVTDALGVTSATFSSTRAESKTISASAAGVPITQVQEVSVTPGTLSATASTLVAVPTTIGAVSGTSTLTVTALDDFSNPIGGLAVVLAASGTGNTLTQPPAVTDASGQAAGTLQSSVSEEKTITATIGGTPITQSATVNVAVGTVSGANSLLTVSDPTATVGTEVTVTVTARDAGNNPVEGVTVVLTGSGTGNTIGAPGTTGPDGVATITFSSTVPGAQALSATVNGEPVTQQGTVTYEVGAVSASRSTVVATPSFVAGVGSSTISVTVRDAFDNPIAGAPVTLATTGGVLTQPAAATDALGVTTGSLTSSATGTFTVTATADGTPITLGADVTAMPGAISAALSTVVADPTTLVAGVATRTITVTAVDVNGNVVPGATVTLDATGTANVLTQPALTDATGVTTGTIASTRAEAKTVTATINLVDVATGVVIIVGPAAVDAATTTVVANPTSIAAASGSSTITVTALDQFSNVVPGADVVLAVDGTANTLTQPGAQTDANGVASGTLQASTVGTRTISATVASTPITQQATVDVTVGTVSAANSTVQASSPSEEAGTPVTVTVTALDGGGNPVEGVEVVFSSSGSSNLFTPATAPTNASGVATATFSSPVAEAKVVSATIGGVPVTQTANVTFGVGPVSPVMSTVSAPVASAIAGGTAVDIVVTARDANGNAISGASVVLSATGTGNTLTNPTAVTDGSGVATGSFATIQAGLKVITATINGVAVTAGAEVTVGPAAVDADESTLTVDPASIVAGTATSTITVTALDAFGNVVPGASVVLAASGSSNTLVQPAGDVVDAAGVGIGQLSSTTSEPKTVTATVGGVPLTASAVVTVTPGAAVAAVSTIVASAATAVAGTPVNVTLTAFDANGNRVPSAPVGISSPNPNTSVAAGSGTTDLNGEFTTTVTSTLVQTVVVEGTVNAEALPTSDSFDVTAGEATTLVIPTPPNSPIAGQPFAPEIEVFARDDFGNATDFAGDISLAIVDGTGTIGASFVAGSQVTVTASQGRAAFPNVAINLAGSDYRLIAVFPGLVGTPSEPFGVTPAAADTVVFTNPPSTAAVGAPLGSPIVVVVRDAFGNTVTSYDGVVTLSIVGDPGAGFSDPGAATANAVAGVASFNGVAINLAGTGYQLQASAADVPGTVLSSVFDVVAETLAAAGLAIPSFAIRSILISTR